MTLVVGVGLTVTTPYVFRIVRTCLSYFLDWLEQDRAAAPTNAQTPLLRGQNAVTTTLVGAENSRQFFFKSLKVVRHGKNWRDALRALFVVLVFAAAFIGWLAVGLSSVAIASDHVGLLATRRSGIYNYDAAGDADKEYSQDLHNRDKEERVSQYAQRCYGKPDPATLLSCKEFYRRDLKYEVKREQPCPFISNDVCYKLDSPAILFDTGLVGPDALGINTAETFKWRRQTTCVPLNMSAPFITHDNQPIANRTYFYNFGSIKYKNGKKKDYTLNTTGDPFKQSKIPAYRVEYDIREELADEKQLLTDHSINHSSLFPEVDEWKPRQELCRLAHSAFTNSTLTLIFVQSAHILYDEASKDPVFPALSQFQDKWKSADPRSRVLACVDTSQIYAPDGSGPWEIGDVLPTNVFHTSDFWLSRLSMDNSNTRSSILWRLGSALLAQQKIGQYVSMPLSNRQWELEAEQFYKTSLARLQFDAFAIASAEDSEREGYTDWTPDEIKGNLYGIYKRPGTDYTNISLVGFLGYILLAIMITILSLELPSKRGDTARIMPIVLTFYVGGVWREVAKCVTK